jgi:hypothetical protein
MTVSLILSLRGGTDEKKAGQKCTAYLAHYYREFFMPTTPIQFVLPGLIRHLHKIAKAICLPFRPSIAGVWQFSFEGYKFARQTKSYYAD